MRGLGKGLGALLSDSEEEYSLSDKSDKEGAVELNLNDVVPNADQPRKYFDEFSMSELVNSIRMHGVISPIIVVKQNDKFMIIAGERRWRAAQKAGLKTIPAIVRNYTPKQVKEISLIENLQREDLNPIDTAIAIKQLMQDYNYTQEDVADRIGKSRPAVANSLRLLTLSKDVMNLVAEGRLSAGHARCLVVISNKEAQMTLALKGCDGKVSVRDFEKMVKSFLEPPKPKEKTRQSLELRDLVERMQRSFSTKVSILGNDHKGRIYIDYFSKDDLDRIFNILEKIERV